MLNKTQDNRFSMEDRVLKLLKDNLGRNFFGDLRLAAAVTELDPLLTQIKSTSSDKEAATSGTTEAKAANAETALVDSLVGVCGSLKSLARTNNDASMKARRLTQGARPSTI